MPNRKIVFASEAGETITVRAAEAHLSGLSDEIAAGRAAPVPGDRRANARITSFDLLAGRHPFRGPHTHQATMPLWRGGPIAKEAARQHRDGRGW